MNKERLLTGTVLCFQQWGDVYTDNSMTSTISFLNNTKAIIVGYGRNNHGPTYKFKICDTNVYFHEGQSCINSSITLAQRITIIEEAQKEVQLELNF